MTSFIRDQYKVALKSRKEIRSKIRFYKKKLEELNGIVEWRSASNKDGFLISDEGNILFDVYFKNVEDIHLLNQTLLMMPGIVDTSLFVDILTGMILVNDMGVFKKEKDGEFHSL